MELVHYSNENPGNEAKKEEKVMVVKRKRSMDRHEVMTVPRSCNKIDQTKDLCFYSITRPFLLHMSSYVTSWGDVEQHDRNHVRS